MEENCCPELFGYALIFGITAGVSLCMNCVLLCYKKCENTEFMHEAVIPTNNPIMESKINSI